MATSRQRTPTLGPSGLSTALNIARARKNQGLSLQALESRLEAMGRRISFSGLSKIENATRKVDVDELMSLALALNTSPLALILPTGDLDEEVEVTGGRGSTAVFWLWSMGERSLVGNDMRPYQARSLPSWLSVQSEVESDHSYQLSFGRTPDAPTWQVRSIVAGDSSVSWADEQR